MPHSSASTSTHHQSSQTSSPSPTSSQCEESVYGYLPLSIHALINLNPAHHLILLPTHHANSFIKVNNRHARILSADLPTPPIPLITPSLASPTKTLSLEPSEPVQEVCKDVVLSPLLPPTLPPAGAKYLAALAWKALQKRDAVPGDVVPLAPGIWALVKSASEGVITKSSNVTISLSPVSARVSEAFKEWVLHAWHAPRKWVVPHRRRLSSITEDMYGVVGLTGVLEDVFCVLREFSVGRFVLFVHAAKDLKEAFARAELHDGFVIVPASGGIEEEAMKLFTSGDDDDYLTNGSAGNRKVCVIVVGEELGASAKEAHAVVEVPSADSKERREIVESVVGVIDDAVMKELVRMTSGLARKHVEGLATMYKENGVEGCRKAVQFFGSAVSVDTGGVGWDDVGGLEDAKQQILDLVEIEENGSEEDGEETVLTGGINRRVGVLLYGPPGTGKTLLARAVATEANCSFIAVKGPELYDMYVGESEKNVREVFRRAVEATPCIIFFDEVDALAPNRGRGSDSGGVSDRVVSQLLAELDEVAVLGDVFVIAASNRPDLVDPGLLRPGRLDKVVYVPMPASRVEQVEILRAQTRKFSWEGMIDLARALEQAPDPPGLSGADLYGLASRAWMKAAKRLVETDDNANVINGKKESSGEEIRAAQEWSCNIDRIYGDWFREDKVYDREYPVETLLNRGQHGIDSVVRVSQQDLVDAARELTPSLSDVQLREYQELRARMEGG